MRAGVILVWLFVACSNRESAPSRAASPSLPESRSPAAAEPASNGSRHSEPVKPVFLHSAECGVQAVSTSAFETTTHSVEKNDHRVTYYFHKSFDWWGLFTVSCVAFAPKLTPDQMATLFASQQREFPVPLGGAKVTRHRETWSGGLLFDESDFEFADANGEYVGRWRTSQDDGRFYDFTVITTKQFAAETDVFDLLDGISKVQAVASKSPQETKPFRAPNPGHLDESRAKVEAHSAVENEKTEPARVDTSNTVVPDLGGAWCEENGSCYGEIGRRSGRPKTIEVHGYFRSDGTYVRGHFTAHR
jgi:hypothetical protein